MDDQRKDKPDPKRPPKRNRFQQLQTHNVLADDLKKILTSQIREKIYGLLISCGLFLEQKESF